MSSPKDTICA